MTAFCDTSVLVTACICKHYSHYERARPVLGGIYTFNLQDFRRLAPDLATRISAP